MNINDVKTLGEVAKEYNIPLQTLHSRLKYLKEGKDYRKIEGAKQPYILSKEGIKKIIEGSKQNV